MPGSTPATSQLDWLISTTAMIVLSWSRATRDLLKACPGEGRGRSAGASGHSISWLQRRWCHLLAACPIPSLRSFGKRGTVEQIGLGRGARWKLARARCGAAWVCANPSCAASTPLRDKVIADLEPGLAALT